MIKGLHHNAYRCRDSEETRAFYEDFLGLRMVSAFEINEGRALHTFFEMDDCAYRLCHPNVVPMETAEPSDWCDAPDRLRGAMERRILVECKMRAHPIVVGGVIRQHMPEVPFPQYHDMVEALASDRANQPFDMTVLPWRTWSDRPVANADGLQATGDRGAIRGVAVTDEIARRLIPWKCF